MTDMTYPCIETFDIGPFRFECSGHMYGPEDLAEYALRRRGGLIKHTHIQRPCAGDVEVSWWTEATFEVSA